MKLQAPSSNVGVAQLQAVLGDWLAVELAALGIAQWRWRRGICWRSWDNLAKGRREYCQRGRLVWHSADVLTGLHDCGILPFGSLAGRAGGRWIALAELEKKTAPRRRQGTEK